MTAHQAVVAAASPALHAAIEQAQQRQPGAALLCIELGSHVQAGDLRLLIQYAYSGVLSIPGTGSGAAQAASGPTVSLRTARRLATLAHALGMKQAAALLQVQPGFLMPQTCYTRHYKIVRGVLSADCH